LKGAGAAIWTLGKDPDDQNVRRKTMNENYSKLVSPILSAFVFGLITLGIQSSAFAQGGSELNQQIARLRAVTARYHDINNAIEDGFAPLPPGTCHNGDDGLPVGIAYFNLSRFLSPEVDPDEPEFLSYIPTGDGNVRLVGIAYTNRAFYRDTRPPDTPGYRAGNFVWTQPVIPAYLELVSGPFSLFGQQSRPPFGGRWLYLITVWPWAPNPNGMFADGNPSLTCPPAQ
jgi:hypothetical protein